MLTVTLLVVLSIASLASGWALGRVLGHDTGEPSHATNGIRPRCKLVDF